MTFEKSCGVVIFKQSTSRFYLLLHYKEGHWDFPKGHVESNESELETAIRETKEETGITDIEIVPDFHEKLEYSYLRDGKKMQKSVFFFLGKTKTSKVVISNEHIGYEWLSFSSAKERLTYENAKNILIKSDQVLERAI